ncbi:MAG: recombinase zinc beta ribbon domain-containing protein [Myxococcales bacterium]|nr:recombinase zinc beta ribbon domain-containing protein [Myxococcales bacterium]
MRKDFFERYLKLKTLRALTRDLARRGITRPKTTTKHGKVTGGGGFVVAGVLQILSNPLYIAKRAVEGGKLLDCVWDPLIEPELFEQVQAQLARNREKRPTRRGSSTYTFVLEGLIRCGSCDSVMTHSSANGTGGTYFYYKCSQKHRSAAQACKARDVPAPAAEKFVLSELKKLSVDEKAVRSAVRRANEGRDEELGRVEAELKERRFATQEQGRAIQKLVNAFEDEDSKTVLKSLKTRLVEHEAAQEQLKLEVVNLEARRLDLKQKMLDAEVVADGYRKIPRLIAFAEKKGHRDELKALLSGVVDRIEWRHNPDDPKKGEAAVRLFELPEGWAHPGQKVKQPGEPLISSPGRLEWLRGRAVVARFRAPPSRERANARVPPEDRGARS